MESMQNGQIRSDGETAFHTTFRCSVRDLPANMQPIHSRGKVVGEETPCFVGSDAYWVAREVSLWRRACWKLVLRCADELLFVSPHLEQLVGHRGTVLPFPIATSQFGEARGLEVSPDRDILYYCSSGLVNERIYRLDWMVDYAKSHSDEKITIVGNSSHPADYDLHLPNVQVIPYVEHEQMPMMPSFGVCINLSESTGEDLRFLVELS